MALEERVQADEIEMTLEERVQADKIEMTLEECVQALHNDQGLETVLRKYMEAYTDFYIINPHFVTKIFGGHRLLGSIPYTGILSVLNNFVQYLTQKQGSGTRPKSNFPLDSDPSAIMPASAIIQHPLSEAASSSSHQIEDIRPPVRSDNQFTDSTKFAIDNHKLCVYYEYIDNQNIRPISVEITIDNQTYVFIPKKRQQINHNIFIGCLKGMIKSSQQLQTPEDLAKIFTKYNRNGQKWIYVPNPETDTAQHNSTSSSSTAPAQPESTKDGKGGKGRATCQEAWRKHQ